MLRAEVEEGAEVVGWKLNRKRKTKQMLGVIRGTGL